MTDSASELAKLGGLLFLLSFWHFIVDWGFQSHKEAMNKSTDHKVRAKHCTVYLVGMWPLVYLASSDATTLITAAIVLWLSHFLIDTYIPVYLWAKYLRRYPTFWGPEGTNTIDIQSKRPHVETEIDKFKALFKTPIGLILAISMDQAFHILYLVPIASALTWPEYATTWNLVAILMTTLLVVMVTSGVKELKAG